MYWAKLCGIGIRNVIVTAVPFNYHLHGATYPLHGTCTPKSYTFLSQPPCQTLPYALQVLPMPSQPCLVNHISSTMSHRRRCTASHFGSRLLPKGQ